MFYTFIRYFNVDKSTTYLTCFHFQFFITQLEPNNFSICFQFNILTFVAWNVCTFILIESIFIGEVSSFDFLSMDQIEILSHKSKEISSQNYFSVLDTLGELNFCVFVTKITNKNL